MSTQRLEFSFRRREVLVPPEQGCGYLVVASLDSGASSALDYLTIPCFESTPFLSYDDYRHYFCNRFLEHLTHLPQTAVAGLACSFISQVIDPANTNHLCSDHHFTSAHLVEFQFPPTGTAESAAASALDRVISESFQEAVPRTRPAASLPIFDLILKRIESMILQGGRFDADWTCPDCSIRIDSIKWKCRSLTLPCSHVFHESCILRWFETNHVCPLCRYEMPVESS